MIQMMRSFVMLIPFVLIYGQMSLAEPLTYYQFVTNIEPSVRGEIIWFWTPDTFYGPVHSNDYIALKYSPQFYGPISTARERFRESQANPYFQFSPVFNTPPVEFPQFLQSLRNQATPWVPSQNGQKMTWIKMRGDHGIDIYQYPHGTPRADSLFEHLPVPDDQIIFVDGDVEVEGTLVGTLSIGSSGNMYLLDNCVYEGASETGGFEEDEMDHKLGLASEQNIYIANTMRNGRANGWERNWRNLDQHSIVITAALVALNESFTFEHQNFHWERYQGPTPDERGYIYLKGSIAQYRHGYIHRSNHSGTGYSKSYRYDRRFRRNGPPGFMPGDNGIYEGRHDRVELQQRWSYRIRNANIGTLIVNPGVVIDFEGEQPLVVRDSLIMRGTDEFPIIIRPKIPGDRPLIRVAGGGRSLIDIDRVIFEASTETQFRCDSMKVINSEFNGQAIWEGNIQVSRCRFSGETSLSSWNQLLVSHNVFENGLTIAGDTQGGHILNNTITGGLRSGLYLRRFRNLVVENNIIAFSRFGVNNHHFAEPNMGYNNVFGNGVDDYVDCRSGEGSISLNPDFVDSRRGNYHITEESPCINAGNPDSPRDPDGTRADIGAFYFDHPNGAPENFAPTNAECFELRGAYPNPFNSSTTIGYYLPVKSHVTIRVFDLAGRLQMRLVERESNSGSHNIEWTPESLSAGMYLLQMQAGEYSSIRKVMLLK